MRRFKLTPARPYDLDSFPKKNLCSVEEEETDVAFLPSQQQNGKAVNFTADDEELLNSAAMPNQPGQTLYELPAYEISRVVSAEDGSQPILEPIPQEDIIRLESVGNYCYIYTTDRQRTLMAVSLGNVLKHLPNFLRIHRKHAVNELYIKQRYAPPQKSDKGERFLVLTTDEKIPWSRQKLTDIRKDPDNVHLYKKVPKRARKPKKQRPPDESDNPDTKNPTRQAP